MTRLEKLAEIDVMAKFLDHVVQDCLACPCMEDDICDGFCSNDCIKNFKAYLSKEYSDNI